MFQSPLGLGEFVFEITMKHHCMLLVSLLLLAANVRGFEKDMTFSVQAGATECFYQPVQLGQVIEIDYQVIDASFGQLEVSFQLSEPQGRVALADYKKPENSHRHTARLTGDYRFCFDNSFSTISTKTVFFDLLISSGSEESSDYDQDKDMELQEGSQNYLMRVGDIMESVSKVRDNVNHARRLQELISAHEARDRNLAEDMNASVLRTALLHLALIMLVGAGQVLFLESLFDGQWVLLQHVARRLREWRSGWR